MAGRALLLRAEPGFSLPAFERFAPPPPPALVAARLEAGSQPGEIVLDLFGRGGWVARAAIDTQRKGVSLESSALERLLAEIVLRPPDLRHLDAAVQALGASARGETSLKAWIADRFATRCATCDRPVVLDEVVWAAETRDEEGATRAAEPVRKHYRCPICRDQLGGGEQRQAPLDPEDVARARSTEGHEVRGPLAARFPVLDGGDELPRELLLLHTPRQLSALAAILERIEDDLRAAPIEAALRLALLHAIAPASRLATSPGRLAPLRIANGHVKPPSAAQWRERNPWLAFEDGVRIVRGFVQRLESGVWGPVPARLGDDLRSLVEGSSSAVIKQSTPAAIGALEMEAGHLARGGLRPRIRLVLGMPPQRPAADRVAWAYHGTAWALGRDAAATLPLEPLFGPAVKPSWGRQAATITRSLRGVEPALARDARIVFILDGSGIEPLVATVLGGVAAGYRVAAARVPDGGGGGQTGVVELVPPGSGAIPGGPRTRANVALEPVPGGAGDPDVATADRLFAPPERIVNAPFSAQDAGRAIVEAAVEVLKLRGEPVTEAGLAGEILVGLDRAGHLRRLVRPPVVEDEEQGQLPAGPPSAEPGDHVERLVALIGSALADADDRRLTRVEDRWWLNDRTDRDAAAAPLADRVEWAVYSLLSTAGPLSETQFLERIGNMFSGPDLPDEALVRACLESYRSMASTPDRLLTSDDVVRRSHEHGALIGDLVDLGHRLGYSCWIGTRQQSRRIDGVPLAERLDDREIAGPPYFGRIRSDELEEVDVIWYIRGRAAFLWEVEWTAMLGEPVLRRHARMAPDDRIVRMLVVLPERAELVRHKLDRSPLLRRQLEEGSWHVLKANHLRAWAALDAPTMADLEPLLGLDPTIERTGGQLPLFG
ncbi:MAG TPA: hypothetical protein VFL03_01735 [Candidatus Limnocylindrales bacterium]|nr:hypothetical protein [Candidatus Limnocylindrales bacterium]